MVYNKGGKTDNLKREAWNDGKNIKYGKKAGTQAKALQIPEMDRREPD